VRVEIFLDSSDLTEIGKDNPLVAGVTTNPSICRKAGVDNYEAFCRKALLLAGTKPVSLEVLSDDPSEMKREARLLHSMGSNVYVKIPITNSDGKSCLPTVRELRATGVRVNVTAILTRDQITETMAALAPIPALPTIISIFAGRIADTGLDPADTMRHAAFLTAAMHGAKILWASTREVLNIKHAKDAGCHIITVSPEILAKHEQMNGADLTALSLDTVKQFASDAKAAGFRL
jgi:transaldolase